MLFLLGDFGSLDKSQYPSSKGIRSLRRAQPTQLIGGLRLMEQPQLRGDGASVVGEELVQALVEYMLDAQPPMTSLHS